MEILHTKPTRISPTLNEALTWRNVQVRHLLIHFKKLQSKQLWVGFYIPIQTASLALCLQPPAKILGLSFELNVMHSWTSHVLGWDADPGGLVFIAFALQREDLCTLLCTMSEEPRRNTATSGAETRVAAGEHW